MGSALPANEFASKTISPINGENGDTTGVADSIQKAIYNGGGEMGFLEAFASTGLNGGSKYFQVYSMFLLAH